jgi:bacteriocin-like protein
MKSNEGFTQDQAAETTSKTEEPVARVLNDDELSSVTGGAVAVSDSAPR